MKYFVYVSSAKVDQLYDQLTNVAASSIKIKRTRGRKRAGKAEVSMFSALSFGGDIEGESGEEWEMTGNRSAVQKLRSVLAHLEQNADIGDLDAVCRAKARKPLNSFAYLYRGEFVVLGELQRERSHGNSTYGGDISINAESLKAMSDLLVLSKSALIEPAKRENEAPSPGDTTTLISVSNIAILASRIADFTLELACSMKYFSDMGGSRHDRTNGPDEWDVHPHSGNHHFFRGETMAYFEALVFINGVKAEHIFATPLYLATTPNPNVLI